MILVVDGQGQSVHDAKVFASSIITRKFREGSLPGTLHEVLPGYRDVSNYPITDPAYRLTPFALKSTTLVQTTSWCFLITCYVVLEILLSARLEN